MYLAIEGIDTCGKSTQINLLHQAFPEAHFTREPGGTALGVQLREILLNGVIHSPMAEMFLFLADRAEHAHELQQFATERAIISDRSLVSGIAYANGYPLEKLLELNKLAVGDLLPDKIVLLWLERHTLEERLSQKEHDRIEQQGIENLLAIQERMKTCLESMQIDYICEPADQSIDHIHQNIVKFMKR